MEPTIAELRALRRACGVYLAHVGAKMNGVSPQYVHQIESGKRRDPDGRYRAAVLALCEPSQLVRIASAVMVALLLVACAPEPEPEPDAEGRDAVCALWYAGTHAVVRVPGGWYRAVPREDVPPRACDPEDTATYCDGWCGSDGTCDDDYGWTVCR